MYILIIYHSNGRNRNKQILFVPVSTITVVNND